MQVETPKDIGQSRTIVSFKHSSFNLALPTSSLSQPAVDLSLVVGLLHLTLNVRDR